MDLGRIENQEEYDNDIEERKGYETVRDHHSRNPSKGFEQLKEILEKEVEIEF